MTERNALRPTLDVLGAVKVIKETLNMIISRKIERRYNLNLDMSNGNLYMH